MSRLNIPVGRNRYLTPAHVRFFRAALEGIDLRRCWEYVELDEDDFSPALAKATVQWIRETTMAACMSAGHPELVGLFRRDPELVKVDALPSIDDFTAEFADGEAFSESEMLELYMERYGVNRSADRRSRLQARLRQAFDLLAKAVYRAPRASDSVAQWLAPHLVPHLQAANIKTLAEVRAALNKKKTARWDEVPGIGEKWSARLTKWMDEHVIVVPPDLAPSAIPTHSEYGILPIERLELRSNVLDAGEITVALPTVFNRGQIWLPYPASNNRIGANNDEDAIERWVAAKAPDNVNTKRAYRRIAERLLLWCRLERRMTFAQMTGEDCTHYRAWLQDLGRKTPEEWAAANWRLPAEAWIGRRGIPRDSTEWRPFEGAMAKSSIAQDLTVLRSFFNYLDEAKIVDGNPFKLMGKANFTKSFDSNSQQFVERGLTVSQRDHLMSGLDNQDELEARLLLILWLGFGCGLRSSEMLSLTMGSIDAGQDRWSLMVVGKGNKPRRVPLSTPVRNALVGYMSTIGLGLEYIIRASSGLDPDTADHPILRTQRGRRRHDNDGKQIASTPKDPMSYQSLNRILKDHMGARSRALEASDPVSAARLAMASAHWLRHSCAVQALKNKVPLNGVQKLLGHSSISVTGRYVVEADEALADAMESALSN
jgi:site-specific recombinase XerD